MNLAMVTTWLRENLGKMPREIKVTPPSSCRQTLAPPTPPQLNQTRSRCTHTVILTLSLGVQVPKDEGEMVEAKVGRTLRHFRTQAEQGRLPPDVSRQLSDVRTPLVWVL
jgi:hypothetical protein